MREQRMHQLVNQQQRSESEHCTFQPAVGGAAYLDAVGGNSSLDVVARGMTWQAMRDARLQAARRAQLEESAPWPVRPHMSQQPRMNGGNAQTPIGDPPFMAPTMSASQRSSLTFNMGFDDSCCGQLPEWAAPRGDAVNVATTPSLATDIAN